MRAKPKIVARILSLLTLLATTVVAESEYQSPTEFIAEAFGAPAPAPRVLWITQELRDQASAMLGRELRGLRMRYWQQGSRSAWILDEIGKELPITTGVVVNTGKIEAIRVLVFRESRGWEVRYPFFTEQFADARITERRELDRRIDNITGATLSVNALKRQARLALLLDAAARSEP